MTNNTPSFLTSCGLIVRTPVIFAGTGARIVANNLPKASIVLEKSADTLMDATLLGVAAVSASVSLGFKKIGMNRKSSFEELEEAFLKKMEDEEEKSSIIITK